MPVGFFLEAGLQPAYDRAGDRAGVELCEDGVGKVGTRAWERFCEGGAFFTMLSISTCFPTSTVSPAIPYLTPSPPSSFAYLPTPFRRPDMPLVIPLNFPTFPLASVCVSCWESVPPSWAARACTSRPRQGRPYIPHFGPTPCTGNLPGTRCASPRPAYPCCPVWGCMDWGHGCRLGASVWKVWEQVWAQVWSETP